MMPTWAARAATTRPWRCWAKSAFDEALVIVEQGAADVSIAVLDDEAAAAGSGIDDEDACIVIDG